MKNQILAKLSDRQIIESVSIHGSVSAAARALGIPRGTFKERAIPLIEDQFKVVNTEPARFIEAPARGVKRFIITSAQTGTRVNVAFLRNLEAYAARIKAEIVVSGFSYRHADAHSPSAYSPYIRDYITKRQINIANKILICNEMNTNPTAVNPLSGFETYTRSMWGVFPHPRISLKSVPTMFNAPPKQIMTTGAVTVSNYIQKKAGIKAEFHHVLGALLVEIDSDADVFCRHLIAERDGSFQDLTRRVSRGLVEDSHHVEAITWGDIHTENLDPRIAQACWGLEIEPNTITSVRGVPTLLDTLRPAYQFFHDVLDFNRRNHHNIWDPHFRFEKHVRSEECVETEITKCALFLSLTQRPWCKSVVIDSNHDRALTRWLKTADYRNDPVNALFFLKTQLATYEAILEEDETFSPFEHSVRSCELDLDNTEFLKNTDSFVICKHAGGGIECALHGDLGANGAKGNVTSFAKMGPKANTADKHAAEIFEGIYQAGHSCHHDMRYNRGGLSSWSPSHIITYPSGKRIILTMVGTKYCAE